MTIARCFALPMLFVIMSTAITSAQDSSAESPTSTVERFIAAFNSHDVEAMLQLTHADVQWLYIHEDTLMLEANGVAALEKAMRGYFSMIPSAHSTVEAKMEAGEFVSVWERVRWEGKNGEKTQSSLAVYEVKEGLIRRVWYYPVQK